MNNDRWIRIKENDLYDYLKDCFIARFYSGGIHEWNGIIDFAKLVASGVNKKDKGWNYPEERENRIEKGKEQSKKLEHERLAKIECKAKNDVFDYYMEKVTIWDFIKMKFGWKDLAEPKLEMDIHCRGLKDIDK